MPISVGCYNNRKSSIMSTNIEDKLDQVLESLNKLSKRIDTIEGKLDLFCNHAVDINTHQTSVSNS